MSISNCPSCSKRIPSGSKSCPYCAGSLKPQRDLNSKKSLIIKIIIADIILTAVIAVIVVYFYLK